jgi:pyrroloquinoline quinone biosynthesis protein E
MLTGNAGATDPVCARSPQHGLIDNALELAAKVRSGQLSQPIVFRDSKTSRQLARAF